MKTIAKMGTMAVYVGFVIAIHVGTATPAQAAPDQYGAIATSHETGAWGYSYNHSTRAQAEVDALNKCGDGGCRVRVWFKNACGAVAKDQRNLGWGWAKTSAEAKARALSACGTRACSVEVWACTDR